MKKKGIIWNIRVAFGKLTIYRYKFLCRKWNECTYALAHNDWTRCGDKKCPLFFGNDETRKYKKALKIYKKEFDPQYFEKKR